MDVFCNQTPTATVEQFKAALIVIQAQRRLSQTRLNLLKAHYHAPDHTTSTHQLSRELRLSGHGEANREYGKLAHNVADELGHELPEVPGGQLHWWRMLAYGLDDTTEPEAEHYQWIMRPELAQALEQLNWVRPKTMTTLLETAIRIAVEAHAGQKDKNGQPYILHPLRVMARVMTEDQKIVAILHDVIEDTPWTPDQLKDRGFPPHILQALDCVTKRKGEAYEDFVTRSASNPIASRVKLADLEDNMDVRRLPQITPKDQERLAKYLTAYHRLIAQLHVP